MMIVWLWGSVIGTPVALFGGIQTGAGFVPDAPLGARAAAHVPAGLQGASGGQGFTVLPPTGPRGSGGVADGLQGIGGGA